MLGKTFSISFPNFSNLCNLHYFEALSIKNNTYSIYLSLSKCPKGDFFNRQFINSIKSIRLEENIARKLFVSFWPAFNYSSWPWVTRLWLWRFSLYSWYKLHFYQKIKCCKKKFWYLERWDDSGVKRHEIWIFKVNFLCQKTSESILLFFIQEYQFRTTFL